MSTFTVTVSGAAYSAGLDPLATQVPGEIGLPEPTVTRQGRGHRYSYEVTHRQAREMMDHLNDLADSWSGGVDPEAGAEGRACRKAAERIEATIRTRAEEFRGRQDARDDLAHPSGVMIAYFARRDPAWDAESETYRRAYRETWDAERWA